MIASYALSAIRALRRDPWHAAVNILGLAVALAASLLVALYVRFELSYEDFVSEPGRVYRVEATYSEPGVPAFLSESAPFAVAGLLENDFADQLAATRLDVGSHLVETDALRSRQAVAVAGEDFFSVLDFPAADGDPAAALRTPGAVVLTERKARQLFGDVDAIGETLRIDGQFDLRVAAILKDLPDNSRFTLDVLVSTATPAFAPAPNAADTWGTGWEEIYVRLLEGARPATLAAELPGFVQRHQPESSDATFIFSLRPLRRIHLAEAPDGSISDRNAVAVLALSATAGFLIFIACFSYINLATARSLRRIKEVGLRKILGGDAPQLALQFFAESAAITVLAFGLAAVLAAASLPAFAVLMDRPLGLADALTPGFGAVAAGLLGVVSLAAGAYPALVLASRKPAELFQKRPGSAAAASVLRTGIVSLQFGLTTAMMIAAVVGYAQLRHLRHIDLGFDANDVLIISTAPEHMQAGADLTFRDALAASPSVVDATARSMSPNVDYGLFTNSTLPNGDAPVTPVLGAFAGDAHFFSVYGLEPLAGRVFSADRGTDLFHLPSAQQPVVQTSVVLSESAVSAYRFASAEDAVGETLVWPVFGGRVEQTIVGVVPDVHLRLGRQRMLPTVYAMNDANSAQQLFPFPEIAVRVRPGAEQAAIEDARRIWAEQFPDTPMSYEFLNLRITAANADDGRLSQLLGVFAGLSLFVSCLGLFSLASFAAAQRTHEIAVRKVLGSSRARVARLLMWDFAKPVLLANVVAWPLAWLAVRPWLDRFAYRIELSPAVFLGVSLVALAVAMATILARTLRAANLHPALVLRDE